MAVPSVLFWMTFCGSVLLCNASPTRRQFGSLTETTSSYPVSAVTVEGVVWDDADEFDLDGDKEWLNEAVISPSSIPQQSDYEDYDNDDDDYSPKRPVSVADLGDDDDDDDVEHRDAEEDSNGNQAEFLFVPSRDNRLMLQDDDDDSGPIKVRHTGKNSFTEALDNDNSDEDSSDSNQKFEFTIDNGDEDDDKNEIEDDTRDFVLDDAPHKDNDNVEVLPRQEQPDDDDDDDDDDDNFVADGDSNGDPMFESPEEDSQVIYGDHVFLY